MDITRMYKGHEFRFHTQEPRDDGAYDPGDDWIFVYLDGEQHDMIDYMNKLEDHIDDYMANKVTRPDYMHVAHMFTPDREFALKVRDALHDKYGYLCMISGQEIETGTHGRQNATRLDAYGPLTEKV